MQAKDLALLLEGRFFKDDVLLKSLAPLYCADVGDLSIAAWPKDTRLQKKTKSSCIIASFDWAAQYLDEVPCAVIAVEDLAQAFFKLKKLQQDGIFLPFAPVRERIIENSAFIDKNAIIKKAIIKKGVIIEAFCIINDDVIIEEEAVIKAGAIINGPSRIGPGTVVGHQSVIGKEAFAPLFSINLPSLGGVLLGPEVKIGALCTVDRALIKHTKIMDRTHLDNMVHCGHDSFIGSDVAIAAQSGLAGFVQIGNGVSIGGQAGIAPQVVVGNHARVSAKSFAHRDVMDFAICSGNPGMPHMQYLRAYARDKRYNKGV